MRGLPLTAEDVPSTTKNTSRWKALLPLTLVAGTGLYFCQPYDSLASIAGLVSNQGNTISPVQCPAQLEPLAPSISFDQWETAEYRNLAAERLSGSIKVKTETFDDGAPDSDDPSYEKFTEFENYLVKTFPVVFKSLKFEKLATHGILLTWEGTNPSLKPIIFMAHQDTVPVPESTVPEWTHPPFEGYFDKEGWIWGRGGGDVKNLLVGQLAAVEALLTSDTPYTPKRTVILSFGFDEEGGPLRSANDLALHIESVYGKHEDGKGALIILDEGEENIKVGHYGKTFVTPALGEKGAKNVKLIVGTPGGHSSVPPAHTSIGILSALLTTLESNAESPQLTSKNPFSYYAQCLATHADESFDENLRKALKDPKRWGEAAEIFAKASARDAAMLTTTQAIDVISGGVKVNALPEQASAFINHRIAVESTVDDLEARYLSLLSPVAEKYNLTIVGFNDEIPTDTPRYLKFFSTWGGNASPVSPAEGTAWDLFSGTARHVFGSDAIVTPYTMNGNTDTRWYWNLSRNVYRFGPLKTNERYNIHTVDERVHIDGHLNTIRWVFALIQNADNVRDEDEDPSGHFSAGVEANRLIKDW